MNNRKRMKNRIIVNLTTIVCLLVFLALVIPGAAIADRSVDIVRKSSQKIAKQSKPLEKDVKTFGTEVAKAAKILVTARDKKKREAEVGTLTPEKKDYYNAQIIKAFVLLKEACDKNHPAILSRLGEFDDAVANAVISTREASGIKKDYVTIYTDRKNRIRNQIKNELDAIESYYEEKSNNNCDETPESRVCTRLDNRIIKKVNRIENDLQNKERLAQQQIKIARAGKEVTDLKLNNLKIRGQTISDQLRRTLATFYENFPIISNIIQLIKQGKDIGIGQLADDSEKMANTLEEWIISLNSVVFDYTEISDVLPNNPEGNEKTASEKMIAIDKKYDHLKGHYKED